MNTIKQIQKWPKKSGKADYLRFLNGHTVTRSEAIRAKCYECVGGDDTKLCLIVDCPLNGFCQWNQDSQTA